MNKSTTVFIVGAIIFSFGLGQLALFDAIIYTKTTQVLQTTDGLRFNLDVYEPKQEINGTKPAVILCHGLAVSKEFFANYAVEFTKLGYIAVCLEFRGHGNTGGYLSGVGLNLSTWNIQFPDFTILQNELNATMAYLQNRGDINLTQIAGIGHSMGGGVILEANVLHPDWFAVNVVLAPLPVMEINTTTPHNLLLLHGLIDEAFTLNTERNLFAQAIGNTSFNYNQVYGTFFDGSARKMNVYLDDHASEFIDPILLYETLHWVQTAIKGQVVAENTVRWNNIGYPVRLFWIITMLLGTVLMLINIGIIVAPRLRKPIGVNYTPERDVLVDEGVLPPLPVDIPPESKINLIKLLSLVVIGAGVGTISFLVLFLTGLMVTAAFVGPLLGSAIAIILIFPKSYYYTHVFASWRDLVIGLILGFFACICFYIFTIHFLNLAPYTRIPYIFLFGGLIFISFYINEGFFRNAIQLGKFGDNNVSKAPFLKRFFFYLKLGSIQTGMQLISFVIPFLVMLLLIANNFGLLFLFALTAALFVVNLLGAVWFEANKSIFTNVLAFTFVFTMIFTAMSPFCPPFAIF